MNVGISLAWIDWPFIEQADVDWLLAADDMASAPAYQRLDATRILAGLAEHRYQLFRFVPGPGALLTAVEEANGIKRLTLVKAASAGVGMQFRQMAELLKQAAREWGCEGLQAHVYGDQERLAKAMMRVGAKVESATLFLPVETEDGQHQDG